MGAGKILLLLFLAGLIAVAVLFVKNWSKIFGKPGDDPSETSGARAYGITHIITIWGTAVVFVIYFLIKG